MRRFDSSFKAPAVASAPLMKARLRPCAVISRLTSSSSPPLSKMASMAAVSSPVRTRSPDARPPEQQADRFDEDRLARAGFAGQDVQAGVEFDLDRINHREVLNAQEAEHENGENSNRNIGLTAISQHDTVLRIALSQRRTVLPRRPFAHAWKPDVRPAHPGDGRCCV